MRVGNSERSSTAVSGWVQRLVRSADLNLLFGALISYFRRFITVSCGGVRALDFMYNCMRYCWWIYIIRLPGMART
ncbi:hypothetical protein [Rubritalea tangerina]|uniref:hypothetical protein n=1 Tax=Rubritalea tangerina TaxID=430798 RepID=UPI00361B7FE8